MNIHSFWQNFIKSAFIIITAYISGHKWIFHIVEALKDWFSKLYDKWTLHSTSVGYFSCLKLQIHLKLLTVTIQLMQQLPQSYYSGLHTDEIEKPVQYDVVKSEHLLEPTLYSCLGHFTLKVPLSTEEFTI